MIEIISYDLNKFSAIIREQLDDSDLALISDVDTIELKPKTDDFELRSPLLLPKLRVLYIEKCHQLLSNMVCQDSLNNLTYLLVLNSPISLDVLTKDVEVPNLKKLTIRYQHIDDLSANWICQQKKLTHLSIPDSDATDSLISMLSCKSTLERLDLFRSNVLFQDNRLLDSVFPLVRSLNVSETNISGASVETIHRMFPRLQRLLATETQLSESDVKKIATWDGLKVLSTGNPDIDFDHHRQTFWD